ncbi:MAG: hypothetical protein SGI86_20770 [Deltaproteobacteria bacterium]|nr:hypothetical protein [Deltaproteobacteria bacterium]
MSKVVPLSLALPTVARVMAEVAGAAGEVGEVAVAAIGPRKQKI